MFVALFAIFITSYFIFNRVEHQFDDYLAEERLEQIEAIEQTLIENYNESGSFQTNQLRSFFHQQAMNHQLELHLYDESGELVLSSDHGGHMMQRDTPSGFDESMTVPLINQNETIGELDVYYSTEAVGSAYAFIEDIRTQAIWAVLLTSMAVLFLSVFMSEHLIRKVKQMAEAIHHMKRSKVIESLDPNEFDQEMKPLAEAYNDLQKALQEEDRLRKQFTADLAHELRTPLSSLRSQIEAYRDGIWEPNEERLKGTHNELMRLVRLVNDLEKLIVSESPQLELNDETLSANTLLQQLIEQFQYMFREKNVGLHGTSDPTSPTFVGDRDKVIQIISNILNNALTHTSINDNVYVKVSHSDEWVKFIIQDEGSGMDEEQIPYLFERFYRGDQSRNRKSGGLGIGLSIAKALIVAHGGKIDVKSTKAEGTTVTVYFPFNKTIAQQ